MENEFSESSTIRFVGTTPSSGYFTAIASIAHRLSSFTLRTKRSTDPEKASVQVEAPVIDANEEEPDPRLAEYASLHSQGSVEMDRSLPSRGHSLPGTTLDESAGTISVLTGLLCTVCTQTTVSDEMLQLSCHDNSSKPHAYCATCLNAVFTCSIEGKTRFPPACCGKAIPYNVAKYFLEEYVKERHWRKVAEKILTTEEVTLNCIACRLPTHNGGCRTSGDDLTRLLLDTSAERSWRQCPQCKTMVERYHGSPRIRCICGVSFCYNCGLKWAECYGCEQDANGPRYRERTLTELIEGDGRKA